MEIVPYQAEHLMTIALQESQQYLGNYINEDLAKSLEMEDWSWTALDGDEVIGCAGVQPIWQGRGCAWSYISNCGPKQFMTIHKHVKKFLDQCYLKRIEMTVDCRFEQGHRWAKALGFHMEAGRMEAYMPSGMDVSLYARIRP